MTNHGNIAIVGGGAAGFFVAINLKEMCPHLHVDIYEGGQRVLAKVAVSGGGRCNCTNTFEDVGDLSSVYPRGHRLLKRLFRIFSPSDAYNWFERHGVKLTVLPDHCVFPASNDSGTIIDCFLREARRHSINIYKGKKIESLAQLSDYDCIVVTTGGSSIASRYNWLAEAGHEIERPVPSLFSLNIADTELRALMGTVVENTSLLIPGTKMRASGPLLITHWGISGPAVLRLSSYAARLLADNNYRLPLSVNWLSQTDEDVRQQLYNAISEMPQRQLTTVCPVGLPTRLWQYLLVKGLADRANMRWCDLGKRDVNRITSILTNDTYDIAGRAPFKDEFVTCGGVSLHSVNPNTLESRVRPNLYFAGEVLDIDGVTGGFNFQAAWTTAYTVASAIAEKVSW